LIAEERYQIKNWNQRRFTKHNIGCHWSSRLSPPW